MRQAVVLALFGAVIVIAGCVDDGGDAASDAAATDVPDVETPTGPARAVVDLEPEVKVAALPVWAPGDWWTWRMDHAYLDSFEVTTVVAGIEGGAYRIGADDAAAALRAQWYHVLPAGLVDAATLGWTAHDEPLSFMSFPLADGDTWTAPTWFDPGVTYQATFEEIDGPDGPEPGFLVTGVPSEGDVTAVTFHWSIARGTFTYIALFPWEGGWLLELTLLGHGTGAPGPAFVALPYEVGFVGYALPHPEGDLTDPAPPVHAFSTGAGWTHYMVMCVLGGSDGAYSIDFVPPEGDAFRCAHSNMPGETTRHFEQHVVEAAPGDYHTAHTATGLGFAFAEVLGIVLTEEPVAL